MPPIKLHSNFYNNILSAQSREKKSLSLSEKKLDLLNPRLDDFFFRKREKKFKKTYTIGSVQKKRKRKTTPITKHLFYNGRTCPEFCTRSIACYATQIYETSFTLTHAMFSGRRLYARESTFSKVFSYLAARDFSDSPLIAALRSSCRERNGCKIVDVLASVPCASIRACWHENGYMILV